MRELLPFVRLARPHWPWLFWAVIAGTVTLLASIGLLAVSGWFLSAAALFGLGLATSLFFDIFTPSAAIRGFALFRTLGRYGERVVAHEATLRLLSSLRVWLYRQVEPQAPAGLLRQRSGDLLSRIVADIDSLDTLFIKIVSPTLIALLVTGVVAGALCWLAPPLAGVFVLFALTAGLLLPLVTARLGRQVGGQIQQKTAQLRVQLLEDLQGAADLAIAGAAERHRQCRLAENERLLGLQEKMARIGGLSTALATLMSGLAATTALFLAIPLAQEGRFAPPILALVTFAVLAAFEAVLPLPAAYQMLGKIRAAARSLLAVSEAAPSVSFPAEGEGVRRPDDCTVIFQQVSFRYPGSSGTPALVAVDLQLPAHSTCALVGRSGSGKTTLAHLLTRFWDPDQGTISIGGENIAHYSEEELRQMVTLVSQKSHIFNASLRENLLLADPLADDHTLWDALERAQLAEFVARLPERLETVAGEGGARLSGGEARALVLARALLRKSPIWILDEPTEGLDNRSRHRFIETLFANLSGKSALLISHSQEALDRVEQICFMENGRIVGTGSHPELIANCPGYRHLVGDGRY